MTTVQRLFDRRAATRHPGRVDTCQHGSVHGGRDDGLSEAAPGDADRQVALVEALARLLATAERLGMGDAEDRVRASLRELIEADSDSARPLRARRLVTSVRLLERQQESTVKPVGAASDQAPVTRMLDILTSQVIPVLDGSK